MNIDSEHWKPTHIFPDCYLVSDNGEVFSLTSNKILKPRLDQAGYCIYSLCSNGKQHTITAHKLVAMAFLPNPENKPQIDHINGIKTDNRVENLRRVTAKENANNPITRERKEKYVTQRIKQMVAACEAKGYRRQKTAAYKGGELIGVFNSQTEAAKYIGTSRQNVWQCLNGLRKHYKGYTFKRVDDKLCV